MDWEAVLRVAVVVAPVVTAVAAGFTRPGASRASLKETAEVIEHLPEGTSARAAVLELLEADARALAHANRLRRDASGLALAIVGSIGFGYLTLWLIQRGAWWGWLLAALSGFLAVIFFVGIFESAQRRDRDAEKQAKQEAKAKKAADKQRRSSEAF